MGAFDPFNAPLGLSSHEISSEDAVGDHYHLLVWPLGAQLRQGRAKLGCPVKLVLVAFDAVG